MKFNIFIANETILKAANLVTEHYDDDMFFALLMKEKSFNNTSDDGHDVARKIVKSCLTMNVKAYKTFSPWSNVIGYASKDTIYCNSRKFDLALKDRTANFMHEPLHLLGYSHKGNRVTEFNKGTVPYKVAEIFVAYLVSIGKL
jgi:hypothetical protein